MKIYTSFYTFFDTNLEFKTNYLVSYKEFNRIFGYFQSKTADKINCSIIKSNNSFHIKAKSKRYSLEYTTTQKPHPDTYLSLFSPVLYEVKDYFLIHAGSLMTPTGKSLIISAPCGFGKTTLTRELLKEGFKLLSDELAPINIKTGLIYPYPRGMGILSKMSKEIIHIPKNKIGDPCSPEVVIFLTLEKTTAGQTIEIALGRIDNEIIMEFKKINGIKEITPVHDRLFPMLRLSLEEGAHIVTKVQEICNKLGIPIIYTLKGKTQPPNFNTMPQIKELSQKDGIFELSQNILNAHNSALLEETYSGSRPRMIFELAGLMNNARFFTLTVGKLFDMVRLVKDICQTPN